MIEDLQNQYDQVFTLRNQASEAEKKRVEETREALIREQEKVAKLQILVEKLQMEEGIMNKKLIDFQAEKVTILMEKMQLEEALAEDSPMKAASIKEASPLESRGNLSLSLSPSGGIRESREILRLKKALEVSREENLELTSANGSEVSSTLTLTIQSIKNQFSSTLTLTLTLTLTSKALETRSLPL